jgi:hypothetical protein
VLESRARDAHRLSNPRKRMSRIRTLAGMMTLAIAACGGTQPSASSPDETFEAHAPTSGTEEPAEAPAPIGPLPAVSPRMWSRILPRTDNLSCGSLALAADGSVWVAGYVLRDARTYQALVHVDRVNTTMVVGDAGTYTDVVVRENDIFTTGIAQVGYDSRAMTATHTLGGERVAAASIPGEVLGMTFNHILPVGDELLLTGQLNPTESGRFYGRLARVDASHRLLFEHTYVEPGYNDFVQSAMRGTVLARDRPHEWIDRGARRCERGRLGRRDRSFGQRAIDPCGRHDAADSAERRARCVARRVDARPVERGRVDTSLS